MTLADESASAPAAIFLDRDGTLIVDRHYLADPAQVELLPGVKDVLHRWLAAGTQLFLLSNQSGIGRGLFTMADAERCHARMLELLELPAPGFSGVCMAPEAPDMPSVYRKPSPRYITEMIALHALDPVTTWMVGDRLSDVQAGLNAGVRSAWITSQHQPEVPPEVWQGPDLTVFYSHWVKYPGAGSGLDGGGAISPAVWSEAESIHAGLMVPPPFQKCPGAGSGDLYHHLSLAAMASHRVASK